MPVEGEVELTPVESRGGVWVKRDDAFEVAGIRGGKARTCWALAQGAGGLVTAGSRSSPQANIVARIARQLGIPCRVHTPEGTAKPELQAALDAGAERVCWKAGYNNVIIARAREDAEARGWREIPFGMECWEAVEQTRRQVANLPAAKRLVVPIGSGMSLAGILWGLRDTSRHELPVLGIWVGAEPWKRLRRYGPPGCLGDASLFDAEANPLVLRRSELKYDEAAHSLMLDGLELDPIYEAKCLPWLRPGDCFWVVGKRSRV